MDETQEDRLDRIVAGYADELARGGEPDEDRWLREAPAEQHDGLRRCFRLMRAGAADAVPSVALRPGVELGGHRIVEELGRGGMAIVYRARHAELDREVALKVLRPGSATLGAHVDRFLREARAIAKVAHPHIVDVYDVGRDGGHHWFAMECIEGPTLARVLSELPRERAWTAADLSRLTGVAVQPGESYERAFARLVEPVARAIGLAHELGILHRDVKPSNILIGSGGRAVVCDFGLAKGPGDPGLSLTGEPLGTPFYMSPEQAAATAEPVDERTDVYGLGVTIFEGLAGRRPFDGDSVLAVLEAIRTQPVPGLRTLVRDRSRDAEAVVRRAMARERGDRYASVLELAADLRALAEGRPTMAGALERGFVATLRRKLAEGSSATGFEYRSQRTLLGLPLVHVLLGRVHGRRVARGWLAFGGLAFGGVAFGGLSLGLASLGGLALGLVTFGGVALGGHALGGVAVGGLAQGGLAVGVGAMGGRAHGVWALGGQATGEHAVSLETGRRDREAVEFGRRWIERSPLVLYRDLLRERFVLGPDE